MERETPSWLVALITVFGIGTATSFGFFLYYHSASASVEEEMALREGQRQALSERQSRLVSLNTSLDEPIILRQQKIADLLDVNQEEEEAIRQLLLPNHTTAVAETKEYVAKAQQTRRQLLEEARVAQADFSAEEQNTLANERLADEERRKLRIQVQEQSQALEQLKEQHRKELLVLDGDIVQREDRVDELLDRIDTASRELRSDGQLLQARADSGYVIIDKGRVHNLLKGTRFQVYNRRGGKNTIKGEIEVYDVQQRLSVCRVLSELDPNDPLIPGDHIHNLIYNPDETKVFVIAGQFDMFNHLELGRFIEDAGGQVDDELSTRTHYLVAGDQADDALSQASLLGVTILSENQLLDFVRNPVSFQVRKGMTFVLAGEFTYIDPKAVRDFIEANGGIIEPRIEDGLHVLVAGENSADAIARARGIGAAIVTQDQLIHLTGSPRGQRRQ